MENSNKNSSLIKRLTKPRHRVGNPDFTTRQLISSIGRRVDDPVYQTHMALKQKQDPFIELLIAANSRSRKKRRKQKRPGKDDGEDLE